MMLHGLFKLYIKTIPPFIITGMSFSLNGFLEEAGHQVTIEWVTQ